MHFKYLTVAMNTNFYQNIVYIFKSIFLTRPTRSQVMTYFTIKMNVHILIVTSNVWALFAEFFKTIKFGENSVNDSANPNHNTG